MSLPFASPTPQYHPNNQENARTISLRHWHEHISHIEDLLELAEQEYSEYNNSGANAETLREALYKRNDLRESLLEAKSTLGRVMDHEAMHAVPLCSALPPTHWVHVLAPAPLKSPTSPLHVS